MKDKLSQYGGIIAAFAFISAAFMFALLVCALYVCCSRRDIEIKERFILRDTDYQKANF